MASPRSSSIRLLMALAAIALVAAWIGHSWMQPAFTPDGAPSRGQDATPPTDSRPVDGRGNEHAGEAARAPIQREAAPGIGALTYLILQEDGRPVAEPSAFVTPAHMRCVTGHPVTVGDADGYVHLPHPFQLPSGARLVFWAPGFLAAAVEALEGGTVTLRRGEALEGIAIDRSGRPVSGLRIALSRTSMTAREAAAVTGHAVPAPGPHAVHGAVSGPDGRFLVDGLSPATYRIHLHHDRLCAYEASPSDSDIVRMPTGFMTIRMDTLYAARLRVEGSTISSVNFRFPEWRCQSPLGARSAESLMASLGLRNGWSADSASYYVAPGTKAHDGARSARIALFFPDSPMQVIDVALHPLAEGHVQTIRVTADPAYSSDVRLHAADARGTPLEGLSVHLTRFHAHGKDAISESHTASVGDSVRIGKGEWRVSTSHPILNRLIADDTITIQDATHDVTLVLDDHLYSVVVACEDFAAGDCLLRVESEAGPRTSVHVRDGEPARLWLPSGAYNFVVSRFGCRSGMAQAAIPTDNGTEVSKVVVVALEPE